MALGGQWWLNFITSKGISSWTKERYHELIFNLWSMFTKSKRALHIRHSSSLQETKIEIRRYSG